MNILFASENLQLGGLALLELWRLAQSYDLNVVGVWADKPRNTWPGIGRAAYDALIKAREVAIPGHISDEGAILGGTYVASYSQLAEELGLRYHHIPDMKSGAVFTALRALKVDVGIICGHSQIFSRSIVETSVSEAWLNLHPSLLPHGRGPFPGFWQFRNGDEESGVTLMRMVRKVDAGPMIAQQSFPMTDGMNFRNLVARQATASADLIRDALVPWIEGELEEVAQPPEDPSFYQPRPTSPDFVLTAEMTCHAIRRFVAGMRDLAPVLVVLDAQKVYQIDGIVGIAPPSGQYPAGHAVQTMFDRIAFEAADGVVELVVSPFGA